MNIALILAGGKGERFCSNVPKQYCKIKDIAIIDYVIKSAYLSYKVDKIIVVTKKALTKYSSLISKKNLEIVEPGNTRIKSIYNGINYIKCKYNCKSLIILDAVRPFVFSNDIDRYLSKLENYDVAISAEKILGGFTDTNNNLLDRENFIITNSPEAFNFNLLYDNFDLDFKYQEIAGMLPATAKRYYDYNLKYNIKITYSSDIKITETIFEDINKENWYNAYNFNKQILITSAFQKNLFLSDNPKTNIWLDNIYTNIKEVFTKWKITKFKVNQISRYGIVLEARSSSYDDVVLKFIPDFLQRYKTELYYYQLSKNKFMCPLIDHFDKYNVLLLKQISNFKYAKFENNKKITKFFSSAMDNLIEENDEICLFPKYIELLKFKVENCSKLIYHKQDISKYLNQSLSMYKDCFNDKQCYLLHMDLMKYNLLDNGKEIIAIDPIGYIAPKEFELVRFVREDLLDNKNFGYQERFKILVDFVSKYVDRKDFVKAFIIDMSFCSYNSVFENTTPQLTEKFIYFIKIALKYLNQMR